MTFAQGQGQKLLDFISLFDIILAGSTCRVDDPALHLVTFNKSKRPPNEAVHQHFQGHPSPDYPCPASAPSRTGGGISESLSAWQ